MKAIERRVGKLEAASGPRCPVTRQIDLFMEGEIQLSDAEYQSLLEQLSDDELERCIAQFESHLNLHQERDQKT
jgi:hypothetical protein